MFVIAEKQDWKDAIPAVVQTVSTCCRYNLAFLTGVSVYRKFPKA
jgi:hypothetical protein